VYLFLAPEVLLLLLLLLLLLMLLLMLLLLLILLPLLPFPLQSRPPHLHLLVPQLEVPPLTSLSLRKRLEDTRHLSVHTLKKDNVVWHGFRQRCRCPVARCRAGAGGKNVLIRVMLSATLQALLHGEAGRKTPSLHLVLTYVVKRCFGCGVDVDDCMLTCRAFLEGVAEASW
jgi:hypothetical protein